MKYEKCKKCPYNNRKESIFPCNKCNGKERPITCDDCRTGWFGGCGKKGVRPCKDFEWS